MKPALGTTKTDKLTRLQVGKLHSSLADTPFQANRVLAVVGSMYAFAGRAGVVPEGTNPARGTDKFKESRRERFLTSEELERLGHAIRKAETIGIPWTVDETKPNGLIAWPSARAWRDADGAIRHIERSNSSSSATAVRTSSIANSPLFLSNSWRVSLMCHFLASLAYRKLKLE